MIKKSLDAIGNKNFNEIGRKDRREKKKNY